MLISSVARPCVGNALAQRRQPVVDLASPFFTGHLIARFGALKIMLAGALMFASCVGVNLSGIAIWQFWSALILLGLGWNCLYIGGSTLLTKAYLRGERAKAQAVNDFLVFGMVTIASFTSGALHYNYGWKAVNLGSSGRSPWFAGPSPGACCTGARPSPESVKGADQPVAPAGRFSYVPAAFRGPRRRRRGRFPRDGWMT
jgi:MFS family permease